MAKTTVFKGAGGFIVKHCGEYFRVPADLANGAKYADEVAETLGEALKKDKKLITRTFPRGKLRNTYLGKNPKMLGETGQGIYRRMLDEGKLYRRVGKDKKLVPLSAADRLDKAGELKPLRKQDLNRIQILDEAGKPHPLKEATMGHHPVDAVDYWTQTGYRKTVEENRTWMTNPDNYFFEYGPDNFRKGGAQTNVYTKADPVLPGYHADVPGT